MLDFMLQHININTDILNNPIYNYLFSVEMVNKEVLSGVPFREAYQNVGIRIEQGDFTPDKQIHHTHEGSIGNLCNEEIERMFQEAEESFNFKKVQDALALLLQ